MCHNEIYWCQLAAWGAWGTCRRSPKMKKLPVCVPKAHNLTAANDSDRQQLSYFLFHMVNQSSSRVRILFLCVFTRRASSVGAATKIMTSRKYQSNLMWGLVIFHASVIVSKVVKTTRRPYGTTRGTANTSPVPELVGRPLIQITNNMIHDSIRRKNIRR